jgi:hypothetical protein
VRDADGVVLYPVKGVSTLARIDEAEITRRYGIPGRAYLDFALLRGDPSDGLPGVRGIGEKTAASLVARYGSLDGVLAARDLSGAVARRIDEGREYLAAARRVVPPVADIPLPPRSLALPREPRDPRRLATLAAEHGLAGPSERIRRRSPDAPGSAPRHAVRGDNQAIALDSAGPVARIASTSWSSSESRAASAGPTCPSPSRARAHPGPAATRSCGAISAAVVPPS